MSDNHPNSMHPLELSRAGGPLADVGDLFVDYFVKLIDNHSILVQDEKGNTPYCLVWSWKRSGLPSISYSKY